MKNGWRPQEARRPKRPDRGGAAVTLCDAPNDRGGTWGEDGTSLEGSPKAAKTSDNGLIGNVLGILLFAFGLASARLPGRGDIEYLPAHLPYRAPWRVTYGPRIHLIDRGSSDGPKVR